MLLLSLGLVVFVGVHLVPSFPSLRQALIAQLGERQYRAVFSLVAFVGVGLLVAGKANAAFVALWQTLAAGRYVAAVLMPLAFILLAAANMPGNVKRFTRHPMLWGVTLWAAGHLAANGDLASLILFGGLGAYSLFDMWSANRRGARKSETRYPLTRDLMVIATGLAAYVAFLLLHPYLFGVSAIA